MVSKAQKIRLGIFLSVSSGLILILLALLAGRMLSKKSDKYIVNFQNTSVSGLQIGGKVRFNGIDIGQIDNISIDTQDITNVVVHISVNAGTPIKKDMQAKMVFAGITGLKTIELYGGSNDAPLLKPGSVIATGSSMVDSLTDKAEILLYRLEGLLTNLQDLTNEENQTHFKDLLANFDGIVSENRSSIHSIVLNADSVIIATKLTMNEANRTVAKLNSILNSPEVTSMIANASKVSDDLASSDIKQTITTLNQAIKTANDTFNQIDIMILRGRQDILRSLETMRETMDYLNEFARQISEDPRRLLLEGQKTQ